MRELFGCVCTRCGEPYLCERWPSNLCGNCAPHPFKWPLELDEAAA